ncbi:MazG nucleotide pyrophosphohydrolase domain-containing protein [Nocardioides sp. Arc9.136]|uniref:MazG nucleotide pyrophosphohydrolase domain-containing protein n=1 Tax=Nocardioides sp. Arc9.136 TaxID=2996826 RepID=UPI00266520A3|nr:MazG nucleotide pyrophosphohydrolase domain-containing protein [Nocardioides sp. Arc9.136]WKN49415.1 nucleoside triphosphate pyrophosphohydrolase [Nocardioides sp. Arc9.136]
MPDPQSDPQTDPQTDGAPLLEFLAVMRRLRAECGWKRAQTHRTLARHLLEETHETLEAIDLGEETGDWSHLREELGDLLLQVYFHAVVAEERGAFTLDDVAADVTAKMHRRNPHVFGSAADAAGVDADDPAAVNEAWEAAKAAEKQRSSVTEGLPPGLPALLYADKVLDRLERAGTPVAASRGDDVGDRLLALVAESRAAGTDPEQALRDAVRRALRQAEGPRD